MDKQQAQNIIKATFESSFDEGRFTGFVRNVLNEIEDASFTYQGNYIPDPYKPYISSLRRIGKYSDGEHHIDILFVQLKKETSLERARTMQRNFIAWYLNGSRGGQMKDAALVAFVSPGEADWRFSLVKMDYRFEETKNGKIKVEEEFTPAKRWSFLVGSNEASHTAQSRLVPILADDENNPNLAQLEDSFNIETVTKEFFLKYRELFIRTKEALDKVVERDARVRADFEANGVDTVNFAKKLLGQIVFLYFLQKKGWFGVERDAEWGTGSKHFLRELFEGKHGKYLNFFNDILEPLFYQALRLDRRHDDDYYDRFNCKIPFLNGGLFDPIGNYDWVHTDINLRNELFSNTVKTKEGDTGNGILDIFDRYNFTVKEDEPLEKDVAIDPELLGKAYEKFNAIRPDNFEEYKAALKSGKKGAENKFNKKFGVYYTPREIVHYMCQQSLINYLSTELDRKASQEDLEKLIKFGDQVGESEAAVLVKQRNIAEGKQQTTKLGSRLPDSIRAQAMLIDDVLASITVCDPAVGSGAFPVGMMHEIVKTRNLLSTFIKDPNRSIYGFKRECIEKSLYGVDIDPGAAEIAKLRLWLSLMVDEEDIHQIKPLPNLDFKIVCGNSLLGVEKNLFNNPLFAELERLKPLHFNETNPTKKQEYKKQIDALISRVTNGHTEFDFEVYFSEVFHEKGRPERGQGGGFDVVIANPPYVKEYVNRSAFDGLRKSPCYQGKMDVWYLFACKGIEVSKNDSGVVTFIAQNNWVTSYGASKMRNKVIKDAQILSLIDFEDFKIFEAGIQTMVMMFKRSDSLDTYSFDYRRIHGSNSELKDIIALLNKDNNVRAEYLTPTITRENFIDKSLTFSGSHVESILQKILSKANFHLDPRKEVAQGIVPNPDVIGTTNLKKIPKNKIRKYGIEKGDGVFVVPRGSFKKLNEYEKSVLKPLFEPTDLSRYFIKNRHTKEIIYLTKSSEENKAPNLLAHLERFRDIMDERRENRNGRLKYYHLHWPRDEHFFKSGPKILSVRKCTRPTFAYSKREAYVMMSINVIMTDRVDTKYLIGVLNSKLITFWLKNRGKMQGTNFQIDKEPILALPLLQPDQTEQNKIANIITNILAITKDDYLENSFKQAKVREYEKQNDQFVYNLYGLTEEEIRIVQGEK